MTHLWKYPEGNCSVRSKEQQPTPYSFGFKPEIHVKVMMFVWLIENNWMQNYSATHSYNMQWKPPKSVGNPIKRRTKIWNIFAVGDCLWYNIFSSTWCWGGCQTKVIRWVTWKMISTLDWIGMELGASGYHGMKMPEGKKLIWKSTAIWIPICIHLILEFEILCVFNAV